MRDVPPSVVIANAGKQHAYQTALAAQEGGMLEQFITGVYYKPHEFPYSLISCLPTQLRESALTQLRKRFDERLDPRRIVSIPYFSLGRRTLATLPVVGNVVRRRIMKLIDIEGSLFDWYVSRIYIFPRCSIFHGFWGSALLSLRRARQLGLVTVLDVPIAPSATRISSEEYDKFGKGTRRGHTLIERLKAELDVADWIFAPSDFVVASLVEVGITGNKIIKIPYGVDTEFFKPAENGHRGPTFRILFVGHVALRKGFQYLLEAVKQLHLVDLELLIVGTPLDKVSERLLWEYKGLYKWSPHVPHDEVVQYFQTSDLFVFPSLVEGSALVTYEAMACGLPLIVTENCGSVVRDGIEGFVVPVGDIGALKERILLLYNNRKLCEQMGQAARKRAEDYTWNHYWQRVVDAYREILKNR